MPALMFLIRFSFVSAGLGESAGFAHLSASFGDLSARSAEKTMKKTKNSKFLGRALGAVKFLLLLIHEQLHFYANKAKTEMRQNEMHACKTRYVPKESNPKNHLRPIFRNNLARQKITSKNKNNLARLFLIFVLKGVFGGSLKITSENKNNFRGKNSLKRFLGKAWSASRTRSARDTNLHCLRP